MSFYRLFTHSSGRLFVLLFASVVMAALFDGSSVHTAAAQAGGDTQPYVLELGRIIHKWGASDYSSVDEPALRVEGRRVWRDSMDLYEHRVVEPNFAPIVFVDHVDIKLVEEDSGLNGRDDNLGTWRVYWDDYDGRNDDFNRELCARSLPGDPLIWTKGDCIGEYEVIEDPNVVTARFSEGGSLYYLTYKVRPATQAEVDAAGFCNGQEGVYLYEHDNFGGRCTHLTADASNLKTSWVGNDTVTSLRFVGCYAATLYEHRDYQGAATRFDTDSTSIKKTTVGNDEASSVVVERTC